MLLGYLRLPGSISWKAATDRLVLSGTIEADEIHVGLEGRRRIEAVLSKKVRRLKRASRSSDSSATIWMLDMQIGRGCRSGRSDFSEKLRGQDPKR